jgi:hypothetical protein
MWLKEKRCVKMWAGLNWILKEPDYEVCDHGDEISRYIKAVNFLIISTFINCLREQASLLLSD